jgi:DNA-binding transcriptional MerR regulator
VTALDSEPDVELSIGEVARQTGLSVHALRYYEREGLLLTQHVSRASGGHRRYGAMDVKWLGLCIKLRASGMPLAQIRRYAELVRDGPGNEPERLELLREQQARVQRRLAELRKCQRIINRKVTTYERHLDGGSGQDLWMASA